MVKPIFAKTSYLKPASLFHFSDVSLQVGPHRHMLESQIFAYTRYLKPTNLFHFSDVGPEVGPHRHMLDGQTKVVSRFRHRWVLSARSNLKCNIYRYLQTKKSVARARVSVCVCARVSVLCVCGWCEKACVHA